MTISCISLELTVVFIAPVAIEGRRVRKHFAKEELEERVMAGNSLKGFREGSRLLVLLKI